MNLIKGKLMGKERTYTYRKDKTNSRTRLVTSVGGYEIPSNCEVLVIFSDKVTDADIEFRMDQIINEKRGHAFGLNRSVLVCGQSFESHT